MQAVDMSEGTHTETDVIDALVSGRAFLWAFRSSGAILEFEDYPQMRICRNWAAGGELEDVLAMRVPSEEWARRNGAQRMEICGRQGWVRKIPGYRKRSVWLSKDLE